jgi:hypothetical protein
MKRFRCRACGRFRPRKKIQDKGRCWPPQPWWLCSDAWNCIAEQGRRGFMLHNMPRVRR